MTDKLTEPRGSLVRTPSGMVHRAVCAMAQRGRAEPWNWPWPNDWWPDSADQAEDILRAKRIRMCDKCRPLGGGGRFR